MHNPATSILVLRHCLYRFCSHWPLCLMAQYGGAGHWLYLGTSWFSYYGLRRRQVCLCEPEVRSTLALAAGFVAVGGRVALRLHTITCAQLNEQLHKSALVQSPGLPWRLLRLPLWPHSWRAIAVFTVWLLSCAGASPSPVCVLTEQFVAQGGQSRWWVIKPFVLGLGAIWCMTLVYYSSESRSRKLILIFGARGLFMPWPRWSSLLCLQTRSVRLAGRAPARMWPFLQLQLFGWRVPRFDIGWCILGRLFWNLGDAQVVAFCLPPFGVGRGLQLSGQWRAALRVSIAKNLFTYTATTIGPNGRVHGTPSQ